MPQQNSSRQNLWLGIGCTSGISAELLVVAIEQVWQNYELPPTAIAKGGSSPDGDATRTTIAGIATIDIKAREPGLVDFCHSYHLPLTTFSAEILSQVAVPHANMAIAKIVGTPSVAEAAAILAASQVNLAVKLLVPKQIIRLPEQPGAVTIAVAQGMGTGEWEKRAMGAG